MAVIPQADPVLMESARRTDTRLNTMIRRVTGVGNATIETGLRVDVDAGFGEIHEGVEIMEPYGIASQPPDGMDAMLLCSGGDAGHPVLLQVGQIKLRLQGLESGDMAIYVGTEADDGPRIICRASGDIEVQPKVGGKVRLGDADPVPAPAVARVGDATKLAPAELASFSALLTAWNATQPLGGPLLATPGVTLFVTPANPGAGSITSGGTGSVST